MAARRILCPSELPGAIMAAALSRRGFVMPLFDVALEEAVKWLVPAGLTAIAAWWVVKRKDVAAWRAARKAERSMHREMIAGWPQVAAYLAGTKEREDKAAARETRTTTEFRAFGDHLVRQDAKLDMIVAQQWAQSRFDPLARFICDHEGRNISVNLSYAQTLRVSESDLLRFGWKLRIHPADLRDYERDVAQAFREHRRYEGTVRMIRGDDTIFRAHVRIEPHPEDPADLTDGANPTWFGAILVVEEIST